MVFSKILNQILSKLKQLASQTALYGISTILVRSLNWLITPFHTRVFNENPNEFGIIVELYAYIAFINVVLMYGMETAFFRYASESKEKQNKVLLDESGLSVAMGIRDGKAQPFVKSSINLTDGQNGEQGGVAVLRYGNEDLTLVFKYAAQGLSHGHYDKLSYSLYEKGDEVLQDYGLARFVNIGQKGGGNYLKENKTWAKTTIAHNTLSQNEQMHFNGKYETASKHHSELYFYDDANKQVQVVSAIENNAYPGTQLHRTMAVIKDDGFEKPFMLDIMKINSDSKNQYDFPYYFMGQVLSQNFEYESPKVLKPLGENNGYQHLYLEASGKASVGNSQFSWFNNNKFYTLTSITDYKDELLFTRIGANDPQFNLRRDPALILRRNNSKNTTFVSAIESHGFYSPVTESAVNSKSSIKELKVVLDSEEYTAISITSLKGNTKLFITANTNASKEAEHKLKINNKNYSWRGSYYYK